MWAFSVLSPLRNARGCLCDRIFAAAIQRLDFDRVHHPLCGSTTHTHTQSPRTITQIAQPQDIDSTGSPFIHQSTPALLVSPIVLEYTHSQIHTQNTPPQMTSVLRDRTSTLTPPKQTVSMDLSARRKREAKRTKAGREWSQAFTRDIISVWFNNRTKSN